MESDDALPLRAAVRLVSRECFPRYESLPGIEQLIDEFIDDFPGQRAFNAACGRGASVRALEYLLGRSAPDWNEAIKAAARSGHLRVLQWMVAKREDRRGPWRVDFSWVILEAAARGHLEVAKWLYQYDTLGPSSGDALSDAAASGHLAVVQWLSGQGVRDRNFDPVEFAAANGHLEVVKWLYGCEYRCGQRGIDVAAANGHLEVVKWLHSKGNKCNTNAMDDAAANGHFEVVKWLHENVKRSWSHKAFVSAACNGHFEVTKWINIHYGCLDQKLVETMADETASHGRLDALKWLYNNGYYITTKAMDSAATNGHLKVVKWLHARKKGCTTAALDGAATNGHLAVLEWLHGNLNEGCTTAAMDGAAENGHFDVVLWLHDHCTQGCTGEAIKCAATNGHLEVVRWLYTVYESQFSIPDLMDSAAFAARRGHLGIVQVLATNSSFSDPKYLTPVMANAFMYGRVQIVEWLLSRGYQVRAEDAQWAQGFWNKRTFKSGTTKIVYRGVEVSVPDVRGILMARGDVRMIRWLWLHGCNTYAFEDPESGACLNGVVVTRWLIENGARMGRDALWDMFYTLDRLEVVDWVPESDCVWVVRQVLAVDEKENSLNKVLWVLDNVEFKDGNSRIAVRDAITEASSYVIQWIKARLQRPDVRTWCFGPTGEKEQAGPNKRQRTD